MRRLRNELRGYGVECSAGGRVDFVLHVASGAVRALLGSVAELETQ